LTKPLPDWTKVHEELKRRGVTLMILCWSLHGLLLAGVSAVD